MQKEEMNEAQEYIRKRILENINLTKTTDEMLEEQVRKEADLYFEGRYVSIGEKAFLHDQIFSSIRGFSILESTKNADEAKAVVIA